MPDPAVIAADAETVTLRQNDRVDGVSTVTVDRSEARNAMNETVPVS